MLEIIIILAATLLLAWPLGAYMAAVMRGDASRLDRFFGVVERPIYRVLGVNPASGMNPTQYIVALLMLSVLLLLLGLLILTTQSHLPLNPAQVPNMNWHQALHTVISFLTNTDQQHYSGQAQLSYFSQMTVIVGLQFISPIMGLAIAVATLRAFFPEAKLQQQLDAVPSLRQKWQSFNVGNFWVDCIRAAIRIFLPLSLLLSLLLSSQGVPSTLSNTVSVHTLETPSVVQALPLGPVAPMVAIKQLGSNGGGWYGPNSTVPFENPTPFSNALQSMAILLIPIAIIFMLGFFTRRKKLAVFVFSVMAVMSVISTVAALLLETHSGLSILSMEGKEQRIGVLASAFWATITTQVNNGSVNMMHDSAAPFTGVVMFANMLINAIWGGIGCGLQQFWVYLLLAVFLSGLMTGRSPELFSHKIDAAEIKLLAILILLQPLVILGFSALALSIPSITANSNPGAHGISQVIYEYTSAFANNGSGFEGLGDNTLWWDLSCSLTLLLGRFPALIIPLLIAVRLSCKRRIPTGQGSLQLETVVFGGTLIAIIVMLTLLQFMPVLVLGPITDAILLAH